MSLILKIFLLCFFTQVTSAFVANPWEAKIYLKPFLDFMIKHDVKIEKEFDLMKFAIPGEECLRECKKDENLVCLFKFRLEFYQVMGGACENCTKGDKSQCFNDQCVTADGYERGIMIVNRQLPGPSIQVCKGDVVVVDVENGMDGTATTIHWHGLRQHGTQFSDGTPFITQCPIISGTTFRYSFYAEDLGTHFWHAHSGLHKANGIHGAIVIRSHDENSEIYDFDLPNFYLIAADWMHVSAEQYFPGLTSRLSIFESALINGRGRFLNKSTNIFEDAPLTIYNVIQNKRYRFRVINAASNVCPLIIQLENHEFEVIASDGSTFKPIKADTLFFISGERYDIVVDTKNTKIRDFWIRIRALPPCTKMIQEFAILRYHKEKIPEEAKNFDFDGRTPPTWEDRYPDGRFFNTHQPGSIGIPISNAKSYRNDQSIVHAKPDYNIKLFIGTPQLDNEIIFSGNNSIKFMVTSANFNYNNVGVFNNISTTFPHFPLLSQPEDIDENTFCDVKRMKNAEEVENSEVHRCVHRIKVKLGSIVEMILYDVDDSLTHPFHLHGHKFYVMDIDNFDKPITAEKIIKGDLPKDRTLKNENPPMKDTILIPNPGYVRVKFRADNPGYWLGHCHFDWHLGIGMAVIFQVGEIEEMRKRPKTFDTCKNFKPHNFY